MSAEASRVPDATPDHIPRTGVGDGTADSAPSDSPVPGEQEADATGLDPATPLSAAARVQSQGDGPNHSGVPDATQGAVETIEAVLDMHNCVEDRCDCGDHEWPIRQTFNRHVAEVLAASPALRAALTDAGRVAAPFVAEVEWDRLSHELTAERARVTALEAGLREAVPELLGAHGYDCPTFLKIQALLTGQPAGSAVPDYDSHKAWTADDWKAAGQPETDPTAQETRDAIRRAVVQGQPTPGFGQPVPPETTDAS